MTYKTPNSILEAIYAERTRQDKQWGSQRNLSWYEWSTILSEENGEVAQEALRVEAGGRSTENMCKELIQVAAVAICALESIDPEILDKAVQSSV